MKPHALALATAATLTVLSAAAHAKGIERVLACGSDGCADVTQRLGIGAQTHAHVILSSGQPTSRPSGAKIARIDVGLGDGSGRARETISLLYAPAAGRIRSLGPNGEPGWFTVSTRQREALARAIDGLALLPAGTDTPVLSHAPAAARDFAERFSVRGLVAPGSGARSGEPAGSAPITAAAVAALALAVVAAAARRLRLRRAPPPYGAA